MRTRAYLAGILAIAAMASAGLAPPSSATTSSGQFTPKSAKITLSSSTSTIKAGGLTLTCSVSSFSLTTNANGTSMVADATSGSILFTGCKALGGLVTAVYAAHGSWDITGGSLINPTDDSWNVNVNVGVGAPPSQGASSITLSTGCVLNIATQALSGSTMTDSLTNLEITDNTVAYTSNNVGLGCPAAGNANFTESGSAALVSTPALTIS